MNKQTLFLAGEGGYFGYRIPALAVTTQGTVLAFCEARRHNGHDEDEIDIVLRRATFRLIASGQLKVDHLLTHVVSPACPRDIPPDRRRWQRLTHRYLRLGLTLSPYRSARWTPWVSRPVLL